MNEHYQNFEERTGQSPADGEQQNSHQPQSEYPSDQMPPTDDRSVEPGHYVHPDSYEPRYPAPRMDTSGNAQGNHGNKRKCTWPVLFAVLLTASITFLATVGVGYVLFGKNIKESLTPQTTASSPGTNSTQTDPNTDPSGSIGTEPSDDGHSITFPNEKGIKEALAKFTTVYNILQENYYKEYSDLEMIQKMTEGLTKQMGSQYTFYLTPEYHASVEDSMKGEYVGIGAIVMRDQNQQYVVNDLIPGGPAEKDGLHVGDIIKNVDGTDASTFEDVGQLGALVRGDEGTEVVIVVYRQSTDEELTFKLKRAAITNVSVRSRMLNDDIGYIQVSEFSQNVAKNFEKAVKDLKANGAKSYVFDLRNNGGGYAHECIDMLDVLLPPTQVASLKGRESGKPYEQIWKTKKPALVPEDTKFVILLNANSASASELFSGALHDLGRAVLVGQKSHGKGVGTITAQLADKSAIQVTTFEYFLPKGESIEGKGIEPDHLVEIAKEVAGKPISMLTLEEDAQLSKAVELLTP